MPVDVRYPRFEEASNKDRVYSPDILPRLQLLLAILADIDVAYEQKLAVIERSPGDENLKQKTITDLWQRRQERRAPYVVELEGLQEQVRAQFSQ